MGPRAAAPSELEFAPATPARWADLERLFGPRGACGGCWCMTPRLGRAEYLANRGEGNRRRMAARIAAGPPPGVLAYAAGEPVGWCSIEPRATLVSLGRSRLFAPLDDRPVWSIVCLFIARGWRRRGVSGRLIRAAVEWAASQGARTIEAYPVEPRGGKLPDAFAWTGLSSAYLALGFQEVARRSAHRPMLRLELAARPSGRARAPRQRDGRSGCA